MDVRFENLLLPPIDADCCRAPLKRASSLLSASAHALCVCVQGVHRCKDEAQCAVVGFYLK